MDILICDDEPLAVERLSRLVSQLGHEVIATAQHGKQALELVQQFEPDVILLDIQMPEMDGLTCAQHLSQMNPMPAVVFCTAYDGDWDPYIDDFATKIPELMDILFGSVEGWPGIKDPSVKQFILDHQITAAGWYVGVPHLTIQDIRRQDRIVKGINKALDEAQS